MATQYSRHEVKLSDGTQLTLIYCDEEDGKIALTITKGDQEIMLQLPEEDFCAFTSLIDSVPENLR